MGDPDSIAQDVKSKRSQREIPAHQIGANAVSGLRILAKVLQINFVHCGVPTEKFG